MTSPTTPLSLWAVTVTRGKRHEPITKKVLAASRRQATFLAIEQVRKEHGTNVAFFATATPWVQ